MESKTRDPVRVITCDQLDRELAVDEDAFAGKIEELLQKMSADSWRIDHPVAYCSQQVHGSRFSGVDRGTEGCGATATNGARIREGGITDRSYSLLATYRAEVCRIPKMSREDEQRLARRLEFLRLRLEQALKKTTLDASAVECATSCHLELPSDADLPRCAEKCFNDFEGTELRSSMDLHRRHCELGRTRNEMIERSLHLVLRLIDRFRGLGVSSLDLIQAGNTSLFQAVQRFDWRHGVRFRTYATYWINQALLNQLYNSARTVRVPVYVQKAMKKINDAFMRLGVPDPELDELARVAKLPVRLVQSVLTSNRHSLSLDHATNGDDTAAILDTIEDRSANLDYEAMEETSMPSRIHAAMGSLGERERIVLCMRYGIGISRSHTLAEVGQRLGITLERVRQIQEQALLRLRGPLGKPFLQYLED